MSISRNTKHTDRNHEKLLFKQTESSHGILGMLRDSRISMEAAANKLRFKDRNAKLASGEMSLELAQGAESTEQRLTWIDKANDSFVGAVSESWLSKPHGLDETLQRALLHLAQMPNSASMIFDSSLPSKEIAYQSYVQSVEQISNLNRRFYRVAAVKDVDTNSLIGLFSESATLLLGQRFAIENMSEGEQLTWWPMLSHYSETHRNTRGSSTEHAWDINVFTQFDGPLEQSYLLQVKTSDKNTWSKSWNRIGSDEDITKVYLNHLALDCDRGYNVARSILRDSAMELEGNRLATDRLNQRTELFLEIIN